MSFLVIAGQSIPVAEGGAAERTERIGTQQSAFAGNLLSSIRAEKRVWPVTTGFLLQSEYDDLRASLALGAHVVCAGDMIGAAPVTCAAVEIGDGAYVTVTSSDGLGFMRTLAFTLREV